jgi:hypothetical protein
VARTTSDAVRAVLRPGSQGGDYDDANSPSLAPFIDAASAMVDDAAACAADQDVPLPAARQELVERWLAAHCYCLSDRTFASRSTLGASASFAGQTGMNLDATFYGQQAMALDSSGCLRALGAGNRAAATWLGKAPSAQTPYIDRD